MSHRAIAIAFISLLATHSSGRQASTLRHINPSLLSKPSGYSHVVVVTGGRTIYVSGQIALDQAGHVVGSGDLRAQTTQVFENLKTALASAGATFANVVKIDVYMADVTQVQVFRDVRDRYFTGEPPASTLVQVARLVRPELLIEIDAVAVVDDAP